MFVSHEINNNTTHHNHVPSSHPLSLEKELSSNVLLVNHSRELVEHTTSETETKENLVHLWSEYAKFVPRFLRRSILGQHFDNNNNNKNSDDGGFAVVAIVDVSGFTKLTSDAGRRGTFGVDMVYKFINSFFAKLMDRVEMHGGDVFKSAGDAIIVVFLPTDDERGCCDGKEKVCLRAVHCIDDLVKEYGCVKFSPRGDVERLEDEACEIPPVGGSNGTRRKIVVDESEVPESDLQVDPEPYVHEAPGDTIDSRVQESLLDIWCTYGLNSQYHRPTLKHTKGEWIPESILGQCDHNDHHLVDSTSSSSGVEEERGRSAVWDITSSLYKSLFGRIISGRSREAIARLSAGTASKKKLDPKTVASMWNDRQGEIMQTAELEAMSQTVYIKGMISCGDVCFYKVGGQYSSDQEPIWEVLLVDADTEGPMHDLTTMDAVIRPGQTLITPAVCSVLGSRVDGREMDGGLLSVHTVDCTDCEVVNESCAVFSEKEVSFLRNQSVKECSCFLEMLSQYIPRTVKSLESELYSNTFRTDSKLRLDPGLSAYRSCSILFLGFPSLTMDHGIKSFQKVFSIVQTVLAETRGDFLQMRNDEKGVILIAGYGLPGHFPLINETESLADTAICACMKMSKILKESGHSFAAGVSSGRSLFATIGSHQRCEYTIYGDSINLAARLMVLSSKRKLEVLCDRETRTLCKGRRFSFNELEPVDLKGMSAHLRVFHVCEVSDSETSKRLGIENKIMFPVGETPYSLFMNRVSRLFVGNEDTISTMLIHINLLKQGKRSTICLEAMAKLGKTSLLKHLFYSRTFGEVDGLTCTYFSTKSHERAGIPGFESILLEMYGNPFSDRQENGTHENWIERFCSTYGISDTPSYIDAAHALFQSAIMENVIKHDDLCDTLSGEEQNDRETDVFSKVMFALFEKYAKRHSQTVIILDCLEHAHPALWRFVRLLHESSIMHMLIVSYNRGFFIYKTLCDRKTQAYWSPDQLWMNHMELANQAGMAYQYGEGTLDDIQSPLMRDLCSVVHDKAITRLRLKTFSLANVKTYFTLAFPTLVMPDENVWQMMVDAVGGHPYCLLVLCMFLYLVNQKSRADHSISAVRLANLLMYQVRTLSPMWGQKEAQFAALPPQIRHVSIHLAIIGDTIPSQVLYEFCSCIDREIIMLSMKFLVFVRHIEEHKDEESDHIYWTATNPIPGLSVLDMLSNETKMNMRARLAMVLERLQYKTGLDFYAIAWNWKESCRNTQGFRWRRSLRSIAAYEDQACVDVECMDYSSAIKCLSQAVHGALVLQEQSLKSDKLLMVPSWRVASWERCMAACELFLENGNCIQSAMHCLKVLAVLGDPLPDSNTDIQLPFPGKKFIMKAYDIATGFVRRKSSREQSHIRPLASMGNPVTVLQYDGPDPNEPLPEAEGLTMRFLPAIDRTVDDEIETERINALEILLYIFQSSGPWDEHSLQFLHSSCINALEITSKGKELQRIRDIERDAYALLQHPKPNPTCSLQRVYSSNRE